MSASLLIFDFDGVIADSFNCFYPMIRDGMASVGISISKKEYKNLFLGNVHEGFKKFIKNDKKKYEMFSNYRKTHISDYYKSSIFPDAINFLKTVKKNGYKTAICSSGQKEIVLKTLNINKIKNCFDMILATGEYTKENMIKEIMNKFESKPEETIMITDTVGDIKLAKKMGLKNIAVTWGFHSKKILKTTEPDFIADSFLSLTSIIFKW